MDGDGYREIELEIEGADPLGHCYLAADGAARRKGLSGSDHLPEDAGLLIPGAPIVHMVGMRYPLDLVFIRPGGRVTRVSSNVVPGLRLRGSLRAWLCLEVNAGTATKLGIERGRRVTWQTPRPPEGSRPGPVSGSTDPAHGGGARRPAASLGDPVGTDEPG